MWWQESGFPLYSYAHVCTYIHNMMLGPGGGLNDWTRPFQLSIAINPHSEQVESRNIFRKGHNHSTVLLAHTD